MAALPALAQFQRGAIVGTITDQSASSVSNQITLKNLGTNEEHTVLSDERGDYTFPSLPRIVPGDCRSQWFQDSVVSNIRLEVNQTARIDLQLTVGDMVQRVEASASLQLLQNGHVEVGAVINNKQIVDLPLNGRDYLQLARLIPGAIPSRAGATAGQKGVTRSVNVAGARDTSVSFLLDGIDTNDIVFQTPSVTPSVDAIQEFKLLANAYSAEFGRGSTQIITALKSGTNQWHSTLFEFNRNNSFAARNFFQPGAVARLNYNQFGGTLGGRSSCRRFITDATARSFVNFEGNRTRSGGTQLVSSRRLKCAWGLLRAE
jgi:hypothetical protein